VAGVCAFTVKEKTVLPVLSVAFFAVTVYTVRALTLVGVPLMVQVVLLILKPAGSVGPPNLTNTTDTNQIVVIGSAIANITFNNSGGAITS
jgi:hypothetical protein